MSSREVLVVEDDAETVSALDSALTASGFHVTASGSSSEAVALIEKHRYSAIVLDLVLSHGDGLAILDVLRRVSSNTPVVVVTQHLKDYVHDLIAFWPQVRLIVHKPATAAVIAANVQLVAAVV